MTHGRGLPIERAGTVHQVTFTPYPRHPGPADGTTTRGRPEQGRNLEHPPDTGHGHPADPAAAPKYSPRAGPGELLTLIDMDHYVEGTFDPDSERVVASAYELHDHIIETFHDHVVTREAIEEWK